MKHSISNFLHDRIKLAWWLRDLSCILKLPFWEDFDTWTFVVLEKVLLLSCWLLLMQMGVKVLNSLIKRYQSWAKSFDTFKRKCQATIIIKVAGWSQNKTEAKQNNIHSNKEPKCSQTNSHQPTRLFCCVV